MQALFDLKNMTLYKMHNVQINDNWIQTLQMRNDNDLCGNDGSSISNFESDVDFKKLNDSVIHGYIDSRCIHNMEDKIIEIAPAKDC